MKYRLPKAADPSIPDNWHTERLAARALREVDREVEARLNADPRKSYRQYLALAKAQTNVRARRKHAA